MKTKLSLILSVFLLFASQVVLAQEKTVSGNVSDNSGLPLPGVNIIVKGTSTGTQSDFDGKYAITASNGQILVYSYVGFKTQEVAITASTNTLNVTLAEDAAQLDEVIVTAQGIKRETKALGYAVSTISADEIENNASGDITRALSGKASGINITQASGLSGSGTQFNIRGISGTGDNTPLFIIDGVPFDGSTNGSGRNQSSRFIDLDPNNIESVNILKGLSAATLYGSDGRNGVVIITTKTGKAGEFNKKQEITLNQSVFFNEIASLPDFTKKKGQGYYGAFWNYFGNWGANYGDWNQGNVDEFGQIPHPYSSIPGAATDYGTDYTTDRYDYKFYDRSKFFKTGIVSSTSLNASGGSEKISYSVSYSKLSDEGFMPGNSLSRDAFGVGGRMKLSNNFTVSASLNGTFTKFETPDISSILSSLWSTPTSIDILGLPFQSPIDGSEVAFRATARNPLWIVNNTKSKNDVTRMFGNILVDYEFSESFKAAYRLGLDTYTELNTSYQNKGSAGDTGFYNTDNLRRTIFDHTILFTYDKKFGDNFRGTAEFGANTKSVRNAFESTSSTNQATYGALGHQFFGTTIANSSVNDPDGFQRARKINKPAVFGQVTLDFKNFIFLTGNARQEWVSNFVNNDIFYPGASISFIPTNAFEGLKSDYINYIKLRAALGSSAGFSDGYPTYQGLGANAAAFTTGDGSAVGTQFEPNALGNTALNPFSISELEFGAETKFLKNRFSFNISLFNRTTKDLIFDRDIDPAVGGTVITQNINEFETKGLEIDFGIIPFKSDDFEWSLNGFFTKNESEVTSLNDARVPFALPFSNADVGNYLIEGQPISTIMGTVVQRDDADDDSLFLTDGNLMITENGEDYIIDPNLKVIGDANPDFVSSLSNSIRYKNLTFSMLWQYRQGGDMYTSTVSGLLQRGISTATDGVDGAQGVILPGVLPNGEQNTIVNDSGDAYLNLYGSADEFNIFDATTIRLQDVSLSYKFSSKLIERTPLGSLSLTVSGQNLWYDAVNAPNGTNFDTNAIGTSVRGNGSGFEVGTSPSSKRYGFSVKATF